MRIDKITHAAISMALGLSLSLILLNPFWGLGITIVLGLAKEVIWDLWLGKGMFDFKDIWFDLLGILAAGIVLGIFIQSGGVV